MLKLIFCESASYNNEGANRANPGEKGTPEEPAEKSIAQDGTQRRAE
jgi:hypothetical protein